MREYTFLTGDGSTVVVDAENIREARKGLVYRSRPKTLKLLKSKPI